MLRLPNDEEDEWERAAAAVALATARPRPSPAASSGGDEVAAAFGSLRIMPPPPPADNGGAFEQPRNGEGVSAATASAVASQLDPVLVSCLENPRERLSMLQFEDQIVRFVKNPREAQLSFPPLSSYHRLIIHRLAQRCFLEHQTGEYNPYAQQQQGYDGNASRVVTLFKTTQTAVPPVLLIDLSTDRQQPAVTPASAPRIMMRKRGAQRPGANGGRGDGAGKDGSKAARSMQDRERAYAEARARIFGEDGAVDSASSISSTTSSAKTPESGGGNNVNGQSRHGNRQAAGPDGSKGFNRARGASPSPNAQEEKASSSQVSQRQQQQQRPARSPVTDPQSWKESKVLWRNREQELNDPDFTRNHGAYRPIRTPNTGSSGGNDGRYSHAQPLRYGGGAPAYVRHGGGEYDRSLPGGYSLQQQQQQQQQQQPFAGGRGRYPSEYSSRVDGMVPPPPPQQQQFYRGGPQQITPPPPVAVMGRGHNAYAAQTRSPSRFQSSTSIGVGSGGSNGRGNGNGGYNEDFPPLGR